jgi:hypothetical protein
MNSLRDLTFPFHASRLLADATLPDKAARERPCEYLLLVHRLPERTDDGTGKEVEDRPAREAKSQTTGVSSSPNGLTPLFAASLLAAAYKDLNIRDDG